jgi:hypothetical protein
MPVDKFGIPFWYPSAKTAGLTGSGSGFFWQQNNDITKEDDYDGSAMVRIGKEHDSSDYKVINSSTGEWQFPFNYSSGTDGLSLSGPTGHHTGGESHGCQGFAYMINVDIAADPPKFRFRKETFHVNYDDDPQFGTWTHPAAPDKVIGHGWFGYGWVRYNKKDGVAPGKDSVILEVWWNNDPEADITKWTMLKRREDKGSGNWGDGGKSCGGAQEDIVGTWSNIQFRFKVDASDFSLHPLKPEPDNGPNINSIGGEDMDFADTAARGYGYRKDMPRDIEMKGLFRFNDTSGKCRIKNLSLREIDPDTDFDVIPEPDPGTGGGTPVPPIDQPPTTSTISGSFKLQRDVNILRANPCAATGNKSYFNWISDESEHNLADATISSNIKRLAEKCKNTNSSLNGKTPAQFDVKLMKVGTPGASPTVNATIRSSSNALKYTSITAVDPTTLTGSLQVRTFDFSTNTYTMQVGDKICVEYEGTSDVNYVRAGVRDIGTTPEADSGNSCLTYFDGSWHDSTSRDLACTIYET